MEVMQVGYKRILIREWANTGCVLNSTSYVVWHLDHSSMLSYLLSSSFSILEPMNFDHFFDIDCPPSPEPARETTISSTLAVQMANILSYIGSALASPKHYILQRRGSLGSTRLPLIWEYSQENNGGPVTVSVVPKRYSTYRLASHYTSCAVRIELVCQVVNCSLW